MKSDINPFSRLSRFSRKPGNSQMSFLELTKLHLARQENTKLLPPIRTSDGRFMNRIVWRSDKAIVFQDPDGHFWRYLSDSGISERALIKPKSN